MATIHIRRATFPEYTGRKFNLEATEQVTLYDLNWSGGTRAQYRAATLSGQATGNASKFNACAPWDNPAEGKTVPVPPGACLVRHHDFCGHDMGLTFYVNPANMNHLALPAAPSLTWAERVVLVATAHLKNTYGGRTNIRFEEAMRYTGIVSAEWEPAKAAMIARGFLTKAGAVTAEGRNAAGDAELRSLKRPAELVTMPVPQLAEVVQ